MTTFCRLDFILRAKDFYHLSYTVPFTLWAASWMGGLQPEWPLFFAASRSLTHFINRCTWKPWQCYITLSIAAPFMHVSWMTVSHQSKCINAIKHILCTTPRIYARILSCICVFLVTAMHVTRNTQMHERVRCVRECRSYIRQCCLYHANCMCSLCKLE